MVLVPVQAQVSPGSATAHSEAPPRPLSARPPRTTVARVSAVVVPTVVTAVLALVGLGRRGAIWQDEAATLSALDRSTTQLFAMLGNVDVVHGVYYTLLQGWMEAGNGIAWARAFSLVFMALSAGLVGALGTRLASPGLGLLAGLLFVVNPTTSFYAQEARSPAITTAFALLATWLLVRALEHPRGRGRWVAFGAACVAAVALNELAALVVVAHAVTVLWWTWRSRRTERRTWLVWVVSVVPAGVVGLVLAYLSHEQAGQVGWIALSAGAFRRLIGLWSGQTVVGLGIGLVLGALALLPDRSQKRRRLLLVALPLFAVPTVALVAVSLLQPLLVPRYVLVTTAGLALLCARGAERLGEILAHVGRRRWSAAVAVPAVAALVVAVFVVGGVPRQELNRTGLSRIDDTASSAELVHAMAQPGDAVLFAPDLRRLDAVTHPDDFAGVRDLSLGEDRVDADNLYGSELPLPVVEERIAASPRIWVVSAAGLHVSNNVAGAADSQAELALLQRDFHLEQTFPRQGVEVALFVRNGG